MAGSGVDIRTNKGELFLMLANNPNHHFSEVNSDFYL